MAKSARRRESTVLARGRLNSVLRTAHAKEPETELRHVGIDQGIGRRTRLPEMKLILVSVDLTSARLAGTLVEVTEQKNDLEMEEHLIRQHLLMITITTGGEAETHHLHQGHPDPIDGQIVIMIEEVGLDQEDIIIGDLSIDFSAI